MVVALVTLAIVTMIWLAFLALATRDGNLRKLDQSLAGILVACLLVSVLGLFLSFKPGFLEVLVVVTVVALGSSIIRFVLIRDGFVLTPGEFEAQYRRIIEGYRRQALDREFTEARELLEDLERADHYAHQTSKDRPPTARLVVRGREKVWRELVARQQATITVLRDDIDGELRGKYHGR